MSSLVNPAAWDFEISCGKKTDTQTEGKNTTTATAVGVGDDWFLHSTVQSSSEGRSLKTSDVK